MRLFLHELHSDALPAPQAAARTGYAGARRRILVVDNEEADRGLLVSLLEPLGFELRTAASGEDCLALLRVRAPAWRPDAIFMDLAMPGIDGWETVRRLRASGWGAVPLAIVSANAFDKGLDNELGHRSQDFFVKPVRREDLLTWLGQRLALQWLSAAPALPESAAATHPCAPPASSPTELAPLLELVRLGYYKGIVTWLDDWVRQRPEQADFAQTLRTLAREFRFEVIEQRLLAHSATAPRP